MGFGKASNDTNTGAGARDEGARFPKNASAADTLERSLYALTQSMQMLLWRPRVTWYGRGDAQKVIWERFLIHLWTVTISNQYWMKSHKNSFDLEHTLANFQKRDWNQASFNLDWMEGLESAMPEEWK